MTQVIVDAALRSRLKGLGEALELCDESGRILARLIPEPNPADYEPVVPPITADELDRRRQEPDFSTAEVLARLTSRP